MGKLFSVSNKFQQNGLYKMWSFNKLLTSFDISAFTAAPYVTAGWKGGEV